MIRLVLASSSVYRRQVLASAGLEVETRPPTFDERSIVDEDPGRMALSIARGKAASVPLAPGEVGIAADQVAWDPVRRIAFGKPEGPDAHRARLLDLGGRHHELHNGFVVWTADGRRSEGVEVVTVWMRREVPPAEIDAYVATWDGAGCAAGYTAEGLGSFLIERIEGDFFSVIGLPLYRLHGVLRGFRE